MGPKTLDSYFLDMMYVELMKNFFLGLLSPNTIDSYFLDMMYVEFMKNYLLAYSRELMADRLIST